MKPYLALVRWDDCCDTEMDHSWMKVEDIKEAVKATDSSAFTVGWIVQHDKEWLVIASSRAKDNGDDAMRYGVCTQIPGAWVRKIKRLK